MMKPPKCPLVQVARPRDPDRLAVGIRAIPKTIGGGRWGTKGLEGEEVVAKKTWTNPGKVKGRGLRRRRHAK